MEVYKVTPANYSALLPRNPEEYQSVLGTGAFTGRPMLARWRHLELEFTDPQQLSTDFFYFGLGAIAFQQRTLDLFASTFERAGELLPFAVGGATYHALNVLKRIDCLDIALSQVKRLSNGKVLKIDRYVFHPRAVAGEDLFLISEELSTLFAARDMTDAATSFFRSYHERGMTGLTFQQVWASDA